ncbi:MAG: hypothetical protein LAT78_00825 [Roseinatronobacter sp.]|nr:hypothetical protein [Roseinatronobacter sp.]
MDDPPFRHRGVQILVDTTATAEFDMQIYDIKPETVKDIALSLRALPQSTKDRSVGNFLIREISGFDVAFIVGRAGRDVIITIGRIRPPDTQEPTELLLKYLNIGAIFRGATGL